MNRSAKMTSKGQVTIPAEVRAVMRVKEGDRLEFERAGDCEFRIRVESNTASLAGMLRPYVKRKKTLRELKEGPARHVRAKFKRAR